MDDDDKKKTEQKICYLSVYRLGRAYGGPEEGGWYYDVYELECSVPFMGLATYTRRVLEDPEDYSMYRNIITDGFVQSWERNGLTEFWMPTSVKPADARTADWITVEEDRLRQLYDINDDSRRRMHTIMSESIRGYMGLLGGPRYS